MYYHQTGDLVYSNYEKFRDNNTLDVKRSKRPYLFICDYEMRHNTGYLLKISSTVGKNSKNNEFYTLVPSSHNKLRRKSYVDLRYVYDIDIKTGRVNGFVNDTTMKKIKRKLDLLQKTKQDSVYIQYLEATK